MLKRMICAVLCLLLAGTVLPAPAQAAIPDGARKVTLDLPACRIWTNLKKDNGEYYGIPGKNIHFSISTDSPLIELDYWETEGITLTEEQRASQFLEFQMPDCPVTLRAVMKEAVCPFNDVSGDNWFYPAVMKAFQAGKMVGTSSTTFSLISLRPVCRRFNVSCKDVRAAVKTLRESCPFPMFPRMPITGRPWAVGNEPCTRAQMAAMLAIF